MKLDKLYDDGDEPKSEIEKPTAENIAATLADADRNAKTRKVKRPTKASEAETRKVRRPRRD